MEPLSFKGRRGSGLPGRAQRLRRRQPGPGRRLGEVHLHVPAVRAAALQPGRRPGDLAARSCSTSLGRQPSAVEAALASAEPHPAADDLGAPCPRRPTTGTGPRSTPTCRSWTRAASTHTATRLSRSGSARSARTTRPVLHHRGVRRRDRGRAVRRPLLAAAGGRLGRAVGRDCPECTRTGRAAAGVIRRRGLPPARRSTCASRPGSGGSIAGKLRAGVAYALFKRTGKRGYLKEGVEAYRGGPRRLGTACRGGSRLPRRHHGGRRGVAARPLVRPAARD